MLSPRLSFVGTTLDPSIQDTAATDAARRVLDAFYLEDSVLSDAEYAPLREAMKRSSVLRLACPENHGGMAQMREFFRRNRARIVSTGQHHDGGYWLARIEWQARNGEADISALGERFAPLADELRAQWSMASSRPRPRIAIFVSRELHCLEDLLSHHRHGALDAHIALVVSNHADAKPLATAHGIPFHRFEMTPHNRADVEHSQIELLDRQHIDLVVLARYMQILSSDFVERYRQRIINVHHSLLPAFAGADAYRRAFARGVRVFGSTSHYVTETLDEGPIIEQQAQRVPRAARLHDCVALGREMEKVALFRAVRWHLEQRIVVYGGKAVVFEERAA
jgi:formyltetrahydrofolate deformylase